MIEINDVIKIEKINIGGEDVRCLSELYMPIIGIDGFSLYVLLNSISAYEITIRKLLDYTHLDSVTILEQSLNKLEGIGLVKKYLKKQASNDAIYKFKRPITKISFYNNSILSNLLRSRIGEVAFKELFKEKNLNGYTEQTLSFDEVYNKDRKIYASSALVNNEMIDESNIVIKNKNFDYTIFKYAFTDDEIDKFVLDDEYFKTEIIKISYMYELSEIEMKDIIIKSINKENDLSLESIKKLAGRAFQNKESSVSLDFPEKTPKIFNVEFTDTENSIYQQAMSFSITKMLGVCNEGKAALSDVNIYHKLLEIHKIPVEVINVLIFHLTGIKKGEPISYNYIEKVAVSWQKEGIKTAKDAIIHIREKEKQEKKTYSKKGSAPTPEWMKENNNEEMKESESTISQDDAKALAKKVFG